MKFLTYVGAYPHPPETLVHIYLQSAIRPCVWDIDGQVHALNVCNVVQYLIPYGLSLSSDHCYDFWLPITV